MAKREREEFLESLMDTSLYSMGAYFTDEHPELVDEVIAQSVSDRGAGDRCLRGRERPVPRGVLRDADDRPRRPLLQGRRGLNAIIGLGAG